MRLIDAGRIRYSDMSDGQVPGGLWYTFKDNVDEIPTVDAIPIEWIKDFANNIWWEDERAVIEDMLEHWEKWDEDDTTGKGTAYHRRIDETV